MIQVAANAAAQFNIQGRVKSVTPFGAGHIHDTFLVESAAGAFLLQRLNTTVFENTLAIFSNLEQLSGLVSKGLIVASIETTAGELNHEDDSGCWRMQQFIANSLAPESPESEEMVAEVARGYALFNQACMSLSPEHFREVIPRFHDLDWRLSQFDHSLTVAKPQRLTAAGKCVVRLQNARWISKHMSELWEQGLPVRVCHNDTKSNNILLDKTSLDFKKVIDLDTVGAGSLLYDFGDMMRTMLSASGESEPDEAQVEINKAYFSALASSYLKVLGDDLTLLERRSLVFGGMYMTYIMAVRFLTDYLNGDIYYKTSYEEENLIRARNQLILLGEMERMRTEMELVIKEL